MYKCTRWESAPRSRGCDYTDGADVKLRLNMICIIEAAKSLDTAGASIYYDISRRYLASKA